MAAPYDNPEWIRELQEELLMTTGEFADFIGASRSAVWAWKSGRMTPQLAFQRKLRDVKAGMVSPAHDTCRTCGREVICEARR